MTGTESGRYSAFRLNLEQQRKRAKALLKAVRGGERQARERILVHIPDAPDELKLAAAQHCIARELRFANWAELKRHIAHLERERRRLDDDEAILDADLRTMHIRCGHDIESSLRQAGLHGDFNLHINPYLEGPVTPAPDWLEQRARYIVDSIGPYQALDYDAVLQACRDEERRLAAAITDYQRVVLWFEHDRYDQFVLLRCLAFFAEHGAPPLLELAGAPDFPGAERFLGLGQLPPEALRLLWSRRRALDREQLELARQLWRDFRSPDPRPLAAFARGESALLPDMPRALRRHLAELPSVRDGLGLSAQLLLNTLEEYGPLQAGKLVGLLMYRFDPLPGLGDISHDRILRELGGANVALLRRKASPDIARWAQDELEITESGRRLLAGELHADSLPLPERWVGGVRISPGKSRWYWNDRTKVVEAAG